MRPEYLSQGELARLFPVLATTSKEGRTTSIFLACMAKIDEFGKELLRSVSQKTGVRASIECYTEIVFKGEKNDANDRPDGLIIVRNGSREWRALVEAKVGNNELSADQVEKYRALAKQFSIDCVITISNQFASLPTHHPVAEVNKSKSKIPVFHWSWMDVLTVADLLLSSEGVSDRDQKLLLNELKRFLSHESAGVRGFDRMPPEWGELNKLVGASGSVPAKSDLVTAVLRAWHQEARDLSLILSRQTETVVSERLPRKHIHDPGLRVKDDYVELRESKCLKTALNITDAAGPLYVEADLRRRTVIVKMSLRAPDDKVSTKARLSWLLRQVKTENPQDIFVNLMWPGRSETTTHSLQSLREHPSVAEEGKSGLQVQSFEIFASKRLGGRFVQQTNFISELEQIVPDFYREIGQNLVPWRKKAPRIKAEREESEDVSVEALEVEAGKDAYDNP